MGRGEGEREMGERKGRIITLMCLRQKFLAIILLLLDGGKVLQPVTWRIKLKRQRERRQVI